MHMIHIVAENSYKCFTPKEYFLSGQWEEEGKLYLLKLLQIIDVERVTSRSKLCMG